MKSRTVLLFSLILVLMGACVEEQSPVEVVRSFMIAVEVFDLAKVESLVCEAQRIEVRESLKAFEDVATLGEAFDLSFEDLSFQEKSNDGSVAVVQAKGELIFSFLGQQEVQEVDEEHVVVKEGGRWVVCDP